MKNEFNRRSFIKKSASAAFGATMLPGGAMLFNGCGETAQSSVKLDLNILSNVNWREMMQGHDLLWKQIPTGMKEAPHFGNGLIGSMIWVEENSVHLQIFRTDVHDHGDHTYGWSAYSRPRYQIGYFRLALKGEIQNCDLRQNIFDADLVGEINTDLGSITIDHFVHRHDDVIYTSIKTSGEEELAEWEWHPFEAKGSRGGSADSEGYGQAYAPYKTIKNLEHKLEDHEGISVGVQDLSLGGNYATGWKENRADTNTTLLVTIKNSYPKKTSVDDAIEIISKTQERIGEGLQQWREEHQSWWNDYYQESFVSFPDSVGQTFYWNNVYRLACCTRPDAGYIDTPGIWNSGGPWPYSTHDFNTQVVHYPVYTANRLHLGEALITSLNRNQKTLIENVVPKEWQHDSAFLNLATAYDLKGKRDGDKRYNEMLGCLPWLLNNCWLHYRYSMDKEILSETLFPLLRRSINLYRHLLFTGEDGKLHLPPTFSPELGNFSDCNFDLALIRWGCLRLIEISQILEIDDPLLPEWENINNQLVDYQVDEKGFKLGKESSAPADHQHMSHLMMIYPLYLENIDNNDNIDLLKKSVQNFQPPTELPKMASSQSSPAAAALGLGNLAQKLMNIILYSHADNETLGKNGIYYLSTPCIETSLSYNTCVQDLLLQSWGKKIRVFPALPDEWKDVAFHNLRTEGAFLISASRKNGKTTFVRIKSLAGEVCIISPAIDGIPKIKGTNNELKEIDKDTYQIELKKGEEVVLHPEDTLPNIAIESMAMKSGSKNYFGMTSCKIEEYSTLN